MVKGVSKSVIEIRNTEDGYIERAILFINPDKAKEPGFRLKAKADAFLQKSNQRISESHSAFEKKRLRFWLGMFAAYLLGILSVIGYRGWI